MVNFYGLWERIHSLSFKHPEYGKIERTEYGEWRQETAEDGIRTLKSDSLKDALVEAEKPYKKPKSKIKTVKQVRKRKIVVAETTEKKVKPIVKKTKKSKKKKR